MFHHVEQERIKFTVLIVGRCPQSLLKKSGEFS